MPLEHRTIRRDDSDRRRRTLIQVAEEACHRAASASAKHHAGTDTAVSSIMDAFLIEPLDTPRLRLEALSPGHADEAAIAFASPALNEFMGGTPLSAAELATRYTLLARGRSANGTQLWFNWMMRATGSGRLVGTVQATVECTATDDVQANVAWVVGAPFQGNGYAKEGACAMVTWLRTKGVHVIEAYIHPDNLASAAVARSLALSQTSTMADGEFLWTNKAKSAPSC